jgi:tetratricopeptide (TPR) repeat protein
MGPGVAAGQRPPVPSRNDSLEAHLGKGYDALKTERFDVAVAEFRAALAVDPKQDLRARFPLAVALFELHESAKARREFEAVRRTAGDHPNIFYYLGRLDLDERNLGGAIRNLKQAAVQPPFPDTAYYLGYAYLQQGDLTDAEKWLKQAAEADPGDARIPYNLGLLYRKQGREDEAKKALALSAELHRANNDEVQLKQECAQKLEQGPREEAHAFCEKLYDANDANKLTALGTIYGQHGDLQAALRPLRRAAELEPQSPQMQYNLALTYYQLDQFEAARASLAGVIERWPDVFQLNALYGAVLSKLGEDAGAYKALRRAHQLNPQEAGAAELLYATTLTLAKKDQDAGQFQDALRYCDEAAELRPNDPGPHRRMAEIHKLAGHAAQATAEEQEADRLAKNVGR